jgi:hypothetical protein
MPLGHGREHNPTVFGGHLQLVAVVYVKAFPKGGVMVVAVQPFQAHVRVRVKVRGSAIPPILNPVAGACQGSSRRQD